MSLLFTPTPYNWVMLPPFLERKLGHLGHRLKPHPNVMVLRGGALEQVSCNGIVCS